MMCMGEGTMGWQRVMVAAGMGVMLSALAACSSTPLFMSDGRPTTQVQCQATDSGSCTAQAQARCGDVGFDTVDDAVQNGVHTLVFACRQQQGAQ